MSGFFESFLGDVGLVGGGVGGAIGGGIVGGAVGGGGGTLVAPGAGTIGGAGYGAWVGGAAGGTAGAAGGYYAGSSAGAWIDQTTVGQYTNQKIDEFRDWVYSDKAAEDEDKDAAPCASCDQARDERQKKRKKELEDQSNVEQKTKGKTKHGEATGGMDQAEKDFDSLEPKNVKDINTNYGKGRTGSLEDGSNVTVRPGSSDGRPTLEIRNPNTGRGTEIRYN